MGKLNAAQRALDVTSKNRHPVWEEAACLQTLNMRKLTELIPARHK